MRIESAHTDESRPARRMSERRVVAAQECDLGVPQRKNRISLGQEGAMKGDEEATADLVVDVPQAGDDVRDPRRKEGPAEAQGTFDTRHDSCGRTAGGEDDHAGACKPRAPQFMKVQRTGIAGPRIGGKEKTCR